MSRKHTKPFKAQNSVPSRAEKGNAVQLPDGGPTASHQQSWLTNRLAAASLAIAGLATYGTGLAGAFQSDDYGQIVGNPIIHSLANIGNFFTGGTFYAGGPQLAGEYYRPLMTVAFSVIYSLFGENAFYFHAFQLGLGIASAYVLYLVFRYSLNPLMSLILSLAFLVHPLNSQALFAIPSTQDALFFFFGIMAIWGLLRFSTIRSLWLVVVLLLLSLLSKESGVLFVFVSILYLWLFDPSRLRPFILRLAFPMISYLALRLAVAGPLSLIPSSPIDALNIAHRLLSVPAIINFYLGKLVWPNHLANSYFWVIHTMDWPNFWLPLLADAVVAGLAIYFGWRIYLKSARAEFKTYVFFAAWAVAGLGIVLQLVPLDMTVCEDWFYFSMAGILGMVGVIIKILIPNRLLGHRTMAMTLVAVVLLLLAGRTFMRGIVYHNPISLALNDIQWSRDNAFANSLAGSYYGQKGDTSQALNYLNASIQIYPGEQNYANLAGVQNQMGDYQDAIKSYDRAISFGIDRIALQHAAEVGALFGDPNRARQLITGGLKLYPSDCKLRTAGAMLDSRIERFDLAKQDVINSSSCGYSNPQLYTDIYNGTPFTINYIGKKITLP